MVALDGDLEGENTEALRSALDRAVDEQTERVTFDFAQVNRVSGAGLAVLWALHARLGAKAARVVLVGVPPGLLAAFTCLGLDREFALAFRPA